MRMTLLLTVPGDRGDDLPRRRLVRRRAHPARAHRRLDVRGFLLVTLAIGLVMAGLILVRIQGPGQRAALAGDRARAAGVLAVRAASSSAIEEPLIDVRLLATPGQWPVQLTAFLFGMSVLGAQIPLSTFARTDPEVTGYGLGASAAFVTVLIVVYVLSLVAGALLLPVVGRLVGTRTAMLVARAAGRARLRPVHPVPRLDRRRRWSTWRSPGVGSGALVAALPAAAAAAAPGRPHRLRHRDDQHHQDDRWRDRLQHLRDRARPRPGRSPTRRPATRRSRATSPCGRSAR